jgi:hypothetical protein
MIRIQRPGPASPRPGGDGPGRHGGVLARLKDAEEGLDGFGGEPGDEAAAGKVHQTADGCDIQSIPHAMGLD